MRTRLALVAALLAGTALAAVAPKPATAVPPAGLECQIVGDTRPGHEPVLLVHGTFTNGWEHWRWNWHEVLMDEGWDVCVITLPNRSLGDMQDQGELVADAVRFMTAQTGEQVDVLGHSQGAVHPRWAVKWWADVQAAVDDIVMLAGPQHGTGVSGGGSPFGCFASCWQMRPGSDYLTALNAGDETPGGISYTSIYSVFDELVQPQVPQSTSALDGGTNILVQDVCPGRPVEHVFMMVDFTVAGLIRDAFTNPGAADPARAGGLMLCAGVWMDGADPVSHGGEIMQRDFGQGFPDWENVPEEPPLKPYAQG